MGRERSGGVASGAGGIGTLYRLGTLGEWSDGRLLGQFLDRRDTETSDAAFAALVDRHGPMVLRVCRRILGDVPDAHDAFQATFLILVRKAGTIRSRESVGDWLFRIARRVAVRARVDADRRERRLEALASVSRVLPADGGGDLDHELLLAEVDRLPARYREAVVLHYFEGLSAEAAALRLGCARGTVLSRLSRARQRLRGRLERRGIVFGAAIAAGRTGWGAAVPPALAAGTVRAAAALGLAGATIESVVPAAVAGLARGAARALDVSRLRAAACVLVLLAAGVSIAVAASRGPGQQAPRPAVPGRAMPGPAKAPAAAKPDQSDALVFRGRVVDPDGRPVAGASIVASSPVDDDPLPRLATTGPDGLFEAQVDEIAIDLPEKDGLPAYLAALASGFGPGWVKIDRQAALKGPVTIRLVRDVVMIEGQIIGLEGRGVPGVSVSLAMIADLPDRFLERLQSDAGQADGSILWGEIMRSRLVLTELEVDNASPVLASVRTGPDGRFRIRGIGRDRVVNLVARADAIVETWVTVVTTTDPSYRPLSVSGDDGMHFQLLAPRFELAARPGRTFEGVVHDRDTGRPIAGAEIFAVWSGKWTTSDAQGRFRLTGMPKAETNSFRVRAHDQGYVEIFPIIADTPGLGPIHADIALRRGVRVEGRVVDKPSGRPVRAVVEYMAYRDNTYIKDYTDASILFGTRISDQVRHVTDADGRFRAVVLPGAGVLVVSSLEPGYLAARPLAPEAAGKVLDPGNFVYGLEHYQAIVPINPRPNETTAIPDIVLVPGRTQHVRAVDARGRPVEQIRYVLPEGSWPGELARGAEFSFVHTSPGKIKRVIVSTETRNLSAFVDIKGDEPDPIRVVLRPSGTVAGRLVDEDGRPRPHMRLELQYRLNGSESAEQDFSPPLMTGADGRFRIIGLVPGLSYTAAVLRRHERDERRRYEGILHSGEWTIKPGESIDWGDVRARPLE